MKERVLLIAGGGIGGISLACFTSQTKSFTRIVVFERYSEAALKHSNAGGGIGVWTNSLECLKQLPGVVQKLEAEGSLMPNPGYRTQNGWHLARPASNFAKDFPVLCLQRAHLINTLYDFARAQQPLVEIRYNAQVMSFQEDNLHERVYVQLASGEQVEGDVFVICDGINSKLRNVLLNKMDLPTVHAENLGYTYFRGIAEVHDKEQHKTSFEQWGGHNDRFAIVPLKYPQLFWFAALELGKVRDRTTNLAATTATSLATADEKRQLEELFQNWSCDAVTAPELISATEEIIRTDISKVPNVTSFPWSSLSGRVVLLGDAAHATSPNIAQGAGLCIEDAIVLAHAMKNPTLPMNFVTKHWYETVRKPRAEVVQFVADSVAVVATLPFPLNVLRNTVAWIGTNLLPFVETWLFARAVNWSLGGQVFPFRKWAPPALTQQAEFAQSLLGRIVDVSKLESHVRKFKTNPMGGKGEGTVTVQRGSNPITYLLGALMGLPPRITNERFVASVKQVSREEQVWSRTFAVGSKNQLTYSTTHRVSPSRNKLTEGIGGLLDSHIRFVYDCTVGDSQELRFASCGLEVCGFMLPVPNCLLPQSKWVETPTMEGWAYDGEISLPVFGRVMRYFGDFVIPTPALSNNCERVRALVAGGTGLIGEKVCEALADAGCEVIILSRRKLDAAQLPRGCTATVEWDAKTANGEWTDFIDNNTVLINLAGESVASSWLGWTMRQKKLVVDSRLDSIRAFEEGIKKCAERGVKPRRFLQASASGIYPGSPTVLYTEDSVQVRAEDEIKPVELTHGGEEFRANCCLHIENLALRAVQNQSVPLTLLRIGYVLSAKGGLMPMVELASQLRASRLGSGTQYVPWVHINDLANAVVFLAATSEEPITGAVNVTAPAESTNRDLFFELANARGRYACWIPVPSFALRLAMRDMSVVMLDSAKIYPKVLMDHKFQFEYGTLEHALLACKTDI